MSNTDDFSIPSNFGNLSLDMQERILDQALKDRDMKQKFGVVPSVSHSWNVAAKRNSRSLAYDITSHKSAHALTAWLRTNKTTLQHLALTWPTQPHEWVSASCKDLVDAISNSTQLQSLSLSHLDIGLNTEFLCALTNLTTFCLCNCAVAGSQVQELSCLRQLRNLHFELDEATHGVPPHVYGPEEVVQHISGLTQLTSLSLRSNKVYVMWPFLSSLLPLSQLQGISIRNLLINPEDYEHLHKLPLLGASLRVQAGDQSMDELTSWIQQRAASQLQALDIRSPSKEAPLPSSQAALLIGELAICSQLKVLHLSKLDLTAASYQIGNLTQLTYLHLQKCSIGAGVVSQVGTLSNLRRLQLDGTTGFEDPAALLKRLTSLTKLVVVGVVMFYRDGLQELSKLQHLQELCLLDGPTPAALLDGFLPALTGLTSLHLDPVITGHNCASEQMATIGIITQLTNLRELVLVLADPDMTGISAMDLTRLSQLTFLHVGVQLGVNKFIARQTVSRGVLMHSGMVWHLCIIQSGLYGVLL